MLNKKARTIEKYMKAGASMRLLKQAAVDAVVNTSGALKVHERDKLSRALEIIRDIGFKAENNMFHDNPELSNDYLHVFTGALTTAPVNPVDAEVMRLGRKLADEFFYSGLDPDSIKVLNAIRRAGLSEFNRHDIMRLCRTLKTAEEAQRVLDCLTEHGYLAIKAQDRHSGKGRPRGQMYLVNPEVPQKEEEAESL